MGRTFDNFDEFADNYRDIHNENVRITGAQSEYFAEYKIIELHRLFDLNGKTIIDFGCGDGACYPYFLKYFPRINYIGIDISDVSISIANKKYPNANFIVFDGSNIPVNDNSIDFIFSACVFHHIEWSFHKSLFQQFYIKLSNIGRLCIFEHNPWNPLTVSIVNNCKFDRDARLLSFLQLKYHLKSGGFNKTKTRFTLFFPRNRIFKIFHVLESYISFLPFGGQYFTISTKN